MDEAGTPALPPSSRNRLSLERSPASVNLGIPGPQVSRSLVGARTDYALPIRKRPGWPSTFKVPSRRSQNKLFLSSGPRPPIRVRCPHSKSGSTATIRSPEKPRPRPSGPCCLDILGEGLRPRTSSSRTREPADQQSPALITAESPPSPSISTLSGKTWDGAERTNE